MPIRRQNTVDQPLGDVARFRQRRFECVLPPPAAEARAFGERAPRSDAHGGRASPRDVRPRTPLASVKPAISESGAHTTTEEAAAVWSRQRGAVGRGTVAHLRAVRRASLELGCR